MVLQKELYTLSDTYDFRNLRLPISPGFQCRSISVEECGYFNSLTKPIKIIIRGRKNNYGVIFKVKRFYLFFYEQPKFNSKLSIT